MADAVHLSDNDLVRRAQAGDTDALNSLIALFRPGIVKFCRSRLATYAGGRDAADDVAQETCVAVVGVLPRYREQGVPFAGLVYAIAANKVADAQRRFSRSAVLVDEIPEQTDSSQTPEEWVISGEAVRSALALLERLPDRMREVLVLRAAGVSAEAVGKRFGISANAVRVAQHRAAARLRQLIAESEGHPELLPDPTSDRRRPAA